MSSNGTQKNVSKTLQRPKASTVFAAAFLAGAAAAVGVNRALDVHLAQNVPQVASEPIFVALRTLPEGSPITIYDVALRDWPVAMLPATALRSNATFDGFVLRHPLREGQPVLSLQLAKSPHEPGQQIAAVTRTTPATNRPQKTSAPAFIPYHAAPPIPATMSPAVDKKTKPNNENLAIQTPELASPPTEQELPVQEKTMTDVSPTVAVNSQSVQPAAIQPATTQPATTQPATTQPATTQAAATQGVPSEPDREEESTDPQNNAATSDSIASSEDVLEKPPAQELAPVSQPAQKMMAATVEEKTESNDNVIETGSTEKTMQDLVAARGNQLDDNSLIKQPLQKTHEGETGKVVVKQSSSPTSAEEKVLIENEVGSEQVLVSTDNTAASQRPTDVPPTGTVDEPSSDNKTVRATNPSLTPTPVEPVDITQSIVAEAESRKTTQNAPSVIASQQKIESAQLPTVSSRVKPAPTSAKQQTMRYLVVPERIAVQVDHAFTSPQVMAPPVRSSKSVPSKKSNVRPLPKTAAAGTRSLQPNINQNRQTPKTAATPRPQQLRATAGNPPQPQATAKAESRVATREANKETSKEPIRRSFFPKISAGLSAMGQEWREFRDGPSTSEENSTSRQATQNSPRQQRSASRPQQSR